MLNTVLELVGIAAGLAALVCFVVAAFAVSSMVGTLALGGAFAVVAVVLVVIANRPSGRAS